MSEEWGPWIEHDGGKCPCVGQYVRAYYDDGSVEIGIARDHGNWSYITHYRPIADPDSVV